MTGSDYKEKRHMGTRKKLLLTTLVSTSMALAFLLAFAPVSLPGADADSDGRVDMVDLLNMILDLDKGALTGVQLETPNNNITVHVPQGGAGPISLPASATTTGAAEEVTFVVDGAFVGVDGWNSTGAGAMPGVASATATDGPPFTSVIDLSKLPIASLAGAHMIYALALDASGAITVAEVNYTVIGGQPVGLSPKQNFTVNVVDPAIFDTNGDGILDNPFALLGPGDVWTATVDVMLADGSIVQRQIVIVDLSGSGLKVSGDTGVPVTITDENTGFSVQVNSPTLADLVGADPGTALGGATQAIMVVQLAAQPDALFSSGAPDMGETNPSEVQNGDPVDLSQFAEVSIIYTNDGGATMVDLDTMPGSETVTLRMSGVNPDPDLGANFWSFATEASTSPPLTFTSEAGVDAWDPRFNITAQTAPDTLEADLGTLSIFGAFQSALRIYNIDPNFGPLGGGTSVDLTFGYPGALLTLAQAIAAYTFYFDGMEITPVGGKGGVPRDEWTVELVSPDFGFTSTTAVDVKVQRNAALTEFAQVPGGFTYQDAPANIVLTPNFGDVAGGDTVTVSGTDLSNVVSISFDAGNPGTINFATATDTSFEVTTPPAPNGVPEVVDVVVTTAIGDSPPVSFTYLGMPAFDAADNFTPDFGPTTGGTAVTIFGTQLAGAIAVDFGGTPANIVSNLNNEIMVTTGARMTPGAVQVSITYPGGLVITSTDLFTYFEPGGEPVLATLNPTEGSTLGGDSVTITGANLDNLLAVNGVTFDGINAPTVGAATFSQVVVTSPAHAAGPVDVVATNAVGASNALTFTYTDDVTVTGVSPSNGWAFGNVVVVINGSGFSSAKGTAQPNVTFGGFQATVLNSSDTQIFALAPANTTLLGSSARTADVDVTVTQGASSFTAADAFQYVRVDTSNSITTTAIGFDSSIGGTANITLDGSLMTSPVATLGVPASTGVKGGVVNTFGLARAANTGASDFGLNGLDTLDDPADSGTDVGTATPGAFNFDIHFYAPAANFATAPGTAGFNESVINFANDDQATLTFPTSMTTGLTASEAGVGRIAMLSLDSTLDQPTPSDPADSNTSIPATLAEAYQSTVLPGEFEQDAGGNITEVTSRLRHLTALALRSDVELDLTSFDITLSPTSGGTGGGTTVTISSAEGGLGFVSRVTFGGNNATIVNNKGGAADEFEVVVRTPAGPAGLVDVAIFLASDPATPAVILADAFRYRQAGPGLSLLLLAILGAGIALAAGGRSGGGGGGPCFIATAAYGTPMAAELDTLRSVRDSYLLDSAVGTALVDTYYRVSPAIADVVAQSPVLAAIVRMLLVPVVFCSNLVLAMPKLTTLLAVLCGLAYLAYRRSRKRSEA